MPNTGIVSEDVFKGANGGEVLGDVFQSMELIEDRFFLCINNSDKITIINKKDHKLVGSISVQQPRQILNIKPTKAYVSTLFSNKIYIIDPSTMQVTGNITMPYKNAEGMVLLNGKAYVSAWDTACNKIYRIDIATDAIDAEIPVAGYAPQAILTDVNEHLWVLSGNVSKGKAAALTCIDPVHRTILKSFQFPAKADPLRPVFNGSKDVLYFIGVNYSGGTEHNGIFRMGIHDAALPAKPIISAMQFQYFWALGIHPVENRIYVGDPKGFVQKGSVYVYDTSGHQLSNFDVAVGPGHFYFDN
jgi:YVTN family beta-propeller protein